MIGWSPVQRIVSSKETTNIKMNFHRAQP